MQVSIAKNRSRTHRAIRVEVQSRQMRVYSAGTSGALSGKDGQRNTRNFLQ